MTMVVAAEPCYVRPMPTVPPDADLLACSFRQATNLVDSEVGDETVLLHLGNTTYYGMDSVGTRIWAALKRGATPAAICDELVSVYAVSRPQVEADLRDFLAALLEHAMIEYA
jgi:hypothetical protein